MGVAVKSGRLGVLGGTFDPIHNGHLAIAEEARAQLRLDEVLVVPAGSPWLKADRQVSAAAHRLAMARLAVRCRPHVAAWDAEVRRPGPTYTVDTLEELRGRMADDAGLYFILGLDALMDVGRWHRPCRLFELAVMAAVARPGAPEYDPAVLDGLCAGASRSVRLLRGPMLDVSGEEIRRRASQGLPIDHLVPEAVGRYISDNRLYANTEGRA